MVKPKSPALKNYLSALITITCCIFLVTLTQAKASEENDTLVLVSSNIPEGAQESCNPCYYNPLQYARLDAGYSLGDFIAIDQNYAEFGLFLPLILSNQSLFFTDERVYIFQDSDDSDGSSVWGLSAGLGLRSFICDDHILGANIYYDYLKTDEKNSFHGLSIGLEYLGPCWDFRINSYLSILDDSFTSSPTIFFYPDTGAVISCTVTESSIRKGFDAELGTSLFCWCGFSLYGAAGPYYYDGNKQADFWGAYARLELNYQNYLSLRVRSSYDRTYHSRTQFTALLTLPIDALFCWQSCVDCCRNLLLQPVRRNGIIFTDSCCRYCSAP